jgi:hypothetical protein
MRAVCSDGQRGLEIGCALLRRTTSAVGVFLYVKSVVEQIFQNAGVPFVSGNISGCLPIAVYTTHGDPHKKRFGNMA